MDISVLIGIALGISLMTQAIGIESILNLFYHPASLLIVLGGTVGATLVHFPFTQVIKFGGRLMVIFSMKKHDFQKDIDSLVGLAQKVEQEGKSAILPDIESNKDHFIKTSLQLFVDNVSTDELEQVLNENVAYIMKRHSQGYLFFEQLGKYAPAFGLLGTVIGLIKLLSELENPEAVGPGMSLALVTTFYGILLSNLLFLPLSGRLKTYSFEESLQKEMLVVGIMSLAKGEPSYIIREKMMLFLTHREREKKKGKEKSEKNMSNDTNAAAQNLSSKN
ncbi:motility protein A [Candidatus Marinamargulisbacteria bacterium SCGC AG-439-L15]|nr:motility protein A [Candidatus Marinamargulisbacteria bacterium SCGC AG-439-L15]